jgi:hypothetical protein
MADPAFLQSVLGSLPNVDPDSEAVRAAIGQASQQTSNKSGNDIKFHSLRMISWNHLQGIPKLNSNVFLFF